MKNHVEIEGIIKSMRLLPNGDCVGTITLGPGSVLLYTPAKKLAIRLSKAVGQMALVEGKLSVRIVGRRSVTSVIVDDLTLGTNESAPLQPRSYTETPTPETGGETEGRP
jgi:hypothetical protein